MQVTYSARAQKELKKLPAKDAQAVLAKLAKYAETGEGDVKKLQGTEGTYRLRHGNYRALFERRDTVWVLTVVKRGAAYKR